MRYAHAGLSKREVSLLAVESIRRTTEEYNIAAVSGSFAENVTTEGPEPLSLPVGDRLQAEKALLEVVQIGKPPEVAHTYNFLGISVFPREGVFWQPLKGR